LRLLREKITDERVIRLIGRYLRAGVWVAGKVEQVQGNKGTPQGGPLSPLLANIYLDVLDKELERKGLSFVRYADDCNIYVGSQKAAERVLKATVRFIEKKLKLEVNDRKSGTDRPWKRKYLGYQIREDGQIGVSPSSLKKFRMKVRELWDGQANGKSNELRDRWKRYVVGWWNYYQLAEARRDLQKQEDPWIRRHIRKCFWTRWHKKQGRRNALSRLGLKGRALDPAGSSKGAWRMARSWTMQAALKNRTLKRFGFQCLSDLMG